MNRNFKFEVRFFGKTKEGKDYLMEHYEEVLAPSTEDAIKLGVKRAPIEVIHRMVRPWAVRVMS